MSDNYYENEVRLTGDVLTKPQYVRSQLGVPGAKFVLATRKDWYNPTTGKRESRMYKHNVFVRKNEMQFVLDELQPGAVVRLKGHVEYFRTRSGLTTSIIVDKISFLFENEEQTRVEGEGMPLDAVE